MWAATGMPFGKIIDRLIETSLCNATGTNREPDESMKRTFRNSNSKTCPDMPRRSFDGCLRFMISD